jgi:hypothetical protein
MYYIDDETLLVKGLLFCTTLGGIFMRFTPGLVSFDRPNLIPF